MNTIKARADIEDAIKMGEIRAIEMVHRYSQELSVVTRDQLSSKDMGTLLTQIIQKLLLPRCAPKGGHAHTACLSIHCGHFINNFWRLVKDDPPPVPQAVWNEIRPAVPHFLKALQTAAKRHSSYQGDMLLTTTVDATLELVKGLIDYDPRAMDALPRNIVHLLWEKYLVPPVITGELNEW